MTRRTRERLQRELLAYRTKLACLDGGRYGESQRRRLVTYYTNCIRHVERLLAADAAKGGDAR